MRVLVTAMVGLLFAVTPAYGNVEGWGSGMGVPLTEADEEADELPSNVLGLGEVAAIAGGSQDNYALLTDGTVMAWGDNREGQLGDGTTTTRPGPVHVLGLNGTTAISGGYGNALALRGDGTVVTWGAGPLGRHSSVPVEVPGLNNVVAISAGGQDDYALLKDGTVMAWGEDLAGQLGNGTIGVETEHDASAPVHVQGLTEVVAISGGCNHALALLRSGAVMAWGLNLWGQLGDGNQQELSSVPREVVGLGDVAAISAGCNHSLALLKNGQVKSWGANWYGQLGNGAKTESNVPVTVSGLGGVTAIAAGGYHGLALLGTGAVMSWGENADGQLGNEALNIPRRKLRTLRKKRDELVQAGKTPTTEAELQKVNTELAQLLEEHWTVNSSVPVQVNGLPAANNVAASVFGSLAGNLAASPRVTNVLASTGTAGTTVTIVGTNLTGATAVKFGGVTAAAMIAESPYSITAVAPPGGGMVDITVTTPAGESATGFPDRFRYSTSGPAAKVDTSATVPPKTATIPTVKPVKPRHLIARQSTLTLRQARKAVSSRVSRVNACHRVSNVEVSCAVILHKRHRHAQVSLRKGQIRVRLQ